MAMRRSVALGERPSAGMAATIASCQGCGEHPSSVRFAPRQDPPMRIGLFAAFAAMLLLASPGRAAADDSQEGYYYPKPKVVETYMARVATLADSDRSRRIGFAAALAKEIADKPYPATFYVFAKGDEADKLIIVGTTDGGLSTVYRTRALLAHLTASARLTDF